MLAQGKKIYSRYTEDVHYELWQLYIYVKLLVIYCFSVSGANLSIFVNSEH